jgi:hypothetical protein
MNDHTGKLQLRAVLPQELARQFLAVKPKTLSTPGFAALLIEEALCSRWSVLNYAPTVSVRETPSNTGTKAQPSNEARKASVEVGSSTQEELKSSMGTFLGDGVGKEPEETPRKVLSFSRQIPGKLKPFSTLIEDFWRVKQGSKGDTAWNRLIRNLLAFHEKYGDSVLTDQLELGINGKWKGIELARYEQLKASGKPPETKHPAAQVFTAKDFDNGPSSNPALGQLF